MDLILSIIKLIVNGVFFMLVFRLIGGTYIAFKEGIPMFFETLKKNQNRTKDDE